MSDQFQMDEYCAKILIIMTLYKQQTHFNELHKELKKRNMEFSKPTLSDHLDHLKNAGYITRKEEEGSQFVTYSLNFDRIGKMKEIAERTKRIIKSLRESEKEFFSLPEEEQIETVLSVLFQVKLEEIKAQIELRLDPQNFDKQVVVNFLTSPVLQLGEMWIIRKSVEDEIYRKKILNIIEKLLERAVRRE